MSTRITNLVTQKQVKNLHYCRPLESVDLLKTQMQNVDFNANTIFLIKIDYAGTDSFCK